MLINENIPTSLLNPYSEPTCGERLKEFFKDLLEKIIDVAKRIFKFLKKVFTFPLRLIGAKTFSIPGLLFRLPVVAYEHCFGLNKPQNSFNNDLLCDKGYHDFPERDLTNDEIKHYLLYGCAAAAVQNNKERWVLDLGYHPIRCEDFGLGLQTDNTVLYDPITGLKIIIYENGQNVIIAFGD